MDSIKEIFKNHSFYLIYTAVFLLILNGVILTSGNTSVGFLFSFFGAFSITYFGIYFITKKYGAFNFDLFQRLSLSKKKVELLSNVLFVFSVLAILAHLLHLGGAPAVDALFYDSADEVVHLRRSITKEVPTYINYLAAFNLRGILPFMIFYLAYKDKKILYYALLIIGSFYAFSLLQKSYIVSVLTPVFVYSILTKRRLHLMKYASLITLVVFGLTYAANPELKERDVAQEIVIEPGHEDLAMDQSEEKKVEEESSLSIAMSALWERVTVVPGEMVAKWFQAIPEHKPFLKGDGYRLIAKIRGNEFRNYSMELYPLFYPSYVKRGIHGSVNTASFMYDYANFGLIGLIISGVILALLFIVVERIFKDDFKIKISFNLYYLLILSSSALTTLLFSGGWSIMIFLYLIMIKGRNE